jgi:RNA polymerase sigma-70 factor (sigma-E family)
VFTVPLVGAVTSAPDFAAVFVEHRARALRLARLLTDSDADAEDLVADAFARLYPKWRAGKVDDAGGYVRVAIVNGARSRWRRRAVARNRMPALTGVSSAGVSEDQVAALVDRDRVRGALIALPVQMRAVVALRVLDDLSERETAEVLGVSVGTVKTQLSRAMARLRADLGEDRDE